jgi:formamidopyrimidine-DNA glycosylase
MPPLIRSFEDLPHQMRLLLGVDPAIAEIRLAACLAARHVLEHSAAHPWSATRPMPELPEVETVTRGLAMRMAGHRITGLALNRADLRKALPVGLRARVEGRRVTRLGRRAKYILIHLDDGGVLIAHLGMSGRIVVSEPGGREPPDPHDHIVFTLDDGTVLRFNDARRFGTLDYASEEELPRHPLLAHLGPEPLANDFNGPALAALLKGRATPLKAALLDQRVVAGLGNIYVSESLYWADLSPRRLARTVAGPRAERLAHAIRDVLERAIAAGGSSLRDYVRASGELGYFQHHFAVYDKEGEKCPRCDCTRGIKRIVQSGRSSFYCAKRQR